MRSLLMSLLMIIAVVLIYNTVAGGDDGMKHQLGRSGGAMSDHIKGMSP